MELSNLKEKLKSYKDSEIIITKHAELQAFVREVDLVEVKRNLLDPKKLVYVKRQEAKRKGEEKYDCYFAYSKSLYHRYVLTINGKILIVTIIKINRDWQRSIG